MTQPPPLPGQKPPAAPKNWWGRNWKWFVPVGGVTLLALFAGCVYALMMLIIGEMKGSEPYREAMRRAECSKEVIAALGEPITDGFLPMGSIDHSTSGGQAMFFINLDGPEDEASLHLHAERKRGRWEYLQLVVTLSDGEEIDLDDPAFENNGCPALPPPSL